MWLLDVFQLQACFIYSKRKVNLILVICVKSFEIVIVKITCFIHNAFCLIDLLPVHNVHYCIVGKYTSQYLQTIQAFLNKDRNTAYSWMLYFLLPTHSKYNSDERAQART